MPADASYAGATPSAPEPSRAAEQREILRAGGISLRLWRLYAQAWLVCLLFPILALAQLRPAPIRLLLACAGLAMFVACYTRAMWRHPLRGTARERLPARWAYALLAGLVALALALSLLFGGSFLWLLVGVSAMAGVLLEPRSAFVLVMLLTLLTLASAVALAGDLRAIDWLHVVPLALLVRGLGLDMTGLTRLAGALRELHASRGELARMAVVEERLRLARDLHDLLGHNLALITLKSELAQRLAERDPARAALEMREVETAARQTLREVRVAVAGYRQPTLQSELEGARQLLAAAGIQNTIEQPQAGLPPAADAALAWVVREAVTNVIRHSRAGWCQINIQVAPGRATVEVINNGVVAQASAPSPIRSGLASLAERAAALGGRLAAGPLPDDSGCFRLCVELPIESADTARLETQA